MSIELIEDLCNEEYHDRPELSRSDGVLIADKGTLALQYKRANPMYTSNKPMEFGTMFHTGCESLAELHRKYAIEPEGDKRTKAYKEEKAAMVAAFPDKKFVSMADFQAVEAMVENVMSHPRVTELGNLLHEASLFGECEGVAIKARPDAMDIEQGIIVDWKTTQDASPYKFASSVSMFGYYMQPAWYKDLVQGYFCKEFRFIFVCVEKTPPYQVAVYELAPEHEEWGYAKMLSALADWKHAEATGKYRGYSEEIVTLPAPGYVL